MNVVNTIETTLTPQERIADTLMNAQHALTDLMNTPETYRTMNPELEKDLVSVISKLINIRYNMNRPVNFRPYTIS